jgi:hypothetical protein
MNISYSQPFDLGWRRMKRTLFQPFDLGRWMVLGFTAWLAQLSGGGSGGSDAGQDGISINRDLGGDEGIRESVGGAWSWLTDITGSAAGILLVAVILVVVLVVALLLLWLSSRGRFMFLDNLVHNRTEVTHPWREFRVEGDSLFLWQVVYAIVAFVIVAVLMGGFGLLLLPAAAWDLPGGIGLLAAVGLGMVLFVVVVVVAYIDYFLNFFVVPIMYKHRVRTTTAWGIFLPVFKSHPGSFVFFGLYTLAVMIVMGIAYFIAGVLTCCLGLLLLVLPYLGAVVTLPISVLRCYMNLEFLAQFGDGFTLLAPLTGPAVPPPAPPGSGDFYADGAMIRTEDIGEDLGRDEAGPQGT